MPAAPARGGPRQPNEVVSDLLTALHGEFDRLRAENGRLIHALEELSGQQGASSTSSPAAVPAASSSAPALPARAATPIGAMRLEAKDRERPATPTGGPDGEEATPTAVTEMDTQAGFTRFSPTTSSKLEAEDHYEKFYDFARCFNALCAKNRASISVPELVQMSANQQGLSPLDVSFAGLRPRLEAAIQALNAALGITVSIKSKKPAKQVSLDAFVVIMQRKHAFFDAAAEEVLEALSDVRDILLKEDAFKKVAKATNTTTREIYAASRHLHPQSRMGAVMKYLDPIIGMVITLNAIIIAISTDVAQESEIWQWIEVSFTLIFVLELLIKLGALGCRAFFFGHDMYWNLFDTAVVLIAVLDLVFTLLGTLVQLRNFTIVRLLRFARLTRLIRVLKLKVFKELTLMINGILVGFRTLVWAVVFLGFLLFALGVMLTQMLGHAEASYWQTVCDGVTNDALQACSSSADHLMRNRKELFGNVFRSMFTVFRCFTDGCNSVDGTPLVPYIYNTLGAYFAIFYMIVILFVIFGLFNLIMAIFVESTIANAKHSDARRREARSKEHIQLARKLQEVIFMFCTGGDANSEEELVKKKWSGYKMFQSAFGTRLPGNFADDVDGLADKNVANLSLQVTHSTFVKVLEKPEVRELLDDLDISVSSRHTLFDVLDANGNGTLDVTELVQGLLKLRGAADKGDAVASLLGIRSIQKSIKAMEVLGLHQQQAIENIAAAQERLESSLECSDGSLRLMPWSRSARKKSLPVPTHDEEHSKKCFQSQPCVHSTLDTMRRPPTTEL